MSPIFIHAPPLTAHTQMVPHRGSGGWGGVNSIWCPEDGWIPPQRHGLYEFRGGGEGVGGGGGGWGVSVNMVREKNESA